MVSDVYNAFIVKCLVVEWSMAKEERRGVVLKLLFLRLLVLLHPSRVLWLGMGFCQHIWLSTGLADLPPEQASRIRRQRRR